MIKRVGPSVEEEQIHEFREFIEGDSLPPDLCSEEVQSLIERQMSPRFLNVFFEVLKVQAVSGALTLLICPQFGVGPIGGGDGIMGWIQSYGHVVCGLFCGMVFVIANVLVARFFIPYDLMNRIRSNPVLPYAALGLVSFGVLLMISLMLNGHVPHLHFDFVMAWFAAFVGLPLACLGRGFRLGISK